jgi:arabinogalactan oligomer/maltooligosaccharide transport system substrate-binding protein
MAMVRPPGCSPRPHRRRTLLLTLLCGLSLSGCASRMEVPKLVYLALGTNAEQSIDAQLVEGFQKRLGSLEAGYRQIHPATRFQFSVYTEVQIADAIRHRQRAGLGPDLLFINGDTARQLFEQGLIDPFPASEALQKLFSPEYLKRLRMPDGALVGLPVLVQPQVACFNRKRLPDPPGTLTELLAASAKGHTIGLSVDLDSLVWSAGSMGAIEGVDRTLTGKRPTADQQQRMASWMGWLQNASDQQRITFYANQTTLQDEFAGGRLDWISCSSLSLPRLRHSLGASLGVTNLPSGPGGLASPLNRLRVLALGRSSSQEGRQRALAFSRFTVNPLVQRSLTVGSQNLLPANRFVQVPVQSSRILQAMVTSQEGGRQTDALVGLLNDNDPRLAAAQSLITQLVFGEMSPTSATNTLIDLFARRQP